MVTHSPTLTPTQRQTLAWVAAMLMLWTPQTNLLLRDCAWLKDNHAYVGGTVWLNMPEMGVEGLAEVLAIEPCPPLEEGEGRLVTGTFRHTSGEVYDLKLESESNPIGVTATHPFWSVDREEWISAIDLEIGETLKTLEGTTVVESFEKRGDSEPVYNIEVSEDHIYRVGESAVLVHNASVPTDSEIEAGAKAYRIAHSLQSGRRNLAGIVFSVCGGDIESLPSNFPSSFIISGPALPGEGYRSGDSEREIERQLTADPRIDSMNNVITITYLFTERSVCRTCQRTAIPSIEDKNGGPFTIKFFVQDGAGSAQRLREEHYGVHD